MFNMHTHFPQETVIYALSSADAGRVLGPGLQGALGSDEVLFVK